jgi:hypothetical protein
MTQPIDAEAKRRTEELQKFERAKAGAGPVAAALPTTLAMLFAGVLSPTRGRKASSKDH